MKGAYTYPDVSKDVYRRHANCRCIVDYDADDGLRQDVWTKQWTAPTEDATIRSRKLIGLRVNGVTVTEISDHVIERMAQRNVEIEGIIDALEKPLKIKPTKYNEKGQPSFVVVGRKATVAVNPQTGKLTATYPTHSKEAARLSKKQEGKK